VIGNQLHPYNLVSLTVRLLPVAEFALMASFYVKVGKGLGLVRLVGLG